MIASVPSSRSRTRMMLTEDSDVERRAASTRRLYIRILELEPSALQALDVVDLGADQVHEAHLVVNALDALHFERAIHFGGLVEVEVVRESCAAATDDAQAQRHVGLDPLRFADLVDLRSS